MDWNKENVLFFFFSIIKFCCVKHFFFFFENHLLSLLSWLIIILIYSFSFAALLLCWFLMLISCIVLISLDSIESSIFLDHNFKNNKEKQTNLTTDLTNNLSWKTKRKSSTTKKSHFERLNIFVRLTGIGRYKSVVIRTTQLKISIMMTRSKISIWSSQFYSI